MTVLAIVILVLLVIYVVVGSIRQRRLLINKFVIFLSIIAVGILVLQGQFSKGDSLQTEVPPYQKIAPTVQQAPFTLPTPSRAYYVATFQDNAQFLVLTSYYYYDQKEWELSNIPLPFDRSLPEFRDLKVIKRNIGG